jgi:hypothetical protein
MLQIQMAAKKDKNFRPHPSFNLKPLNLRARVRDFIPKKKFYNGYFFIAALV